MGWVRLDEGISPKGSEYEMLPSLALMSTCAQLFYRLLTMH